MLGDHEADENAAPATNKLNENTPPTTPTSTIGEVAAFPFYQGLSPAVVWIITVCVFVMSGVCEIGGGWLVWQTVRHGKPWYWAFSGSVILVCYGFVATLNGIVDFGRVYAAYGGVFVLMSFAFAYFVDGFHLDVGDWIGLGVIFVGVVVLVAWPR